MRNITAWVVAIYFISNSVGQAAQSELSTEYLNGYSLGMYIANHYKENEVNQFLEGFQDAFKHKIPQDKLSTLINDARSKFLQEKQPVDGAIAAYAYGYLAGFESTEKAKGFDYLNYIYGIADVQNEFKIDSLTIEKAQAIVKSYNKEMLAENRKKIIHIYVDNKQKGDVFLAENIRKKDVQKMDSGMQYKILKSGFGAKPSLNDKVTLNVVGQKINGDIFYDSKKESSKPIQIDLINAIPAWKQALTQMTVGSIWELYVPTDLAYGNIGWKNVVQPGEALIYKIELLSVESKK